MRFHASFPRGRRLFYKNQNLPQMALHNDIGEHGEKLALDFLKAQGYEILETNWRIGKAELDIIAKLGAELIFIEVKTRSSDTFSKPEDAINRKKIRLLGRAAAVYMEQIGHEGEIRFDVISIVDRKNQQPSLRHLVDAFFPKW